MKETIAKVNKTKSWFFEKMNKTESWLLEKINKIDNPYAGSSRKKTEISNQQN